MSDLIKSKVARVLDSREIAIAAGSQQGVKIGMYFDVLDPKGEDILDPDTGDVLGSINRPKVRVKITQVQQRLSVASTFKKVKINVGGTNDEFEKLLASIGPLSRALMPREYVTKYQTLKTDEKTWEDLDEEESYVKKGDPVIQVVQNIDTDEVEDVR